MGWFSVLRPEADAVKIITSVKYSCENVCNIFLAYVSNVRYQGSIQVVGTYSILKMRLHNLLQS